MHGYLQISSLDSRGTCFQGVITKPSDRCQDEIGFAVGYEDTFFRDHIDRRADKFKNHIKKVLC